MMEIYVVPRATGKTTFLLDQVYREPDCQIVVAWAQEADRLVDLLVERCVTDGPPPWLTGRPVEMSKGEWRSFWQHRHAVQTISGFQRGGPRRVLVDNFDAVLSVLFGNVEAATASVLAHGRLPRLPRIKCAVCGGPYNEETDSFGLCGTCLANGEDWDG